MGALDLAPVGEGKKGRFMAIGVQIDGVWAVRILSLDAGVRLCRGHILQRIHSVL